MSRRVVGVVVGACVALLLASATRLASAQDGGSERDVVAVTESVSLKQDESGAAKLLIAPVAGAVVVTVDGTKVEIAAGPCADKGALSDQVTIDAAGGATATQVELCVQAVGVGKARLVAVAANGASVVVSVTVAGPTPAAVAAAPTAINVVTGDSQRVTNVDPGFTVASEMRVIAGGEDDTSLVILSPDKISCDEPTSTTTTTSTEPPAPPAPPVAYLVVCDADSVGEYTATFDLNGDTAGGEVKVTAVRRQTVWLAFAAVLLGLLVAWAVEQFAGRAQRGSESASSQRARAEALGVFEQIQQILKPDDPVLGSTVPSWAPRHWSPLTADPKPGETTSTADATKLYTRAAASVDPLVDLWRHYQQARYRVGLEQPLKLPAAILHDLRFGITLHNDGDTIAKTTERLERHAYLAQHTLGRDLELVRQIDRESGARQEALKAERQAIVSADIDGVDEVPVAQLGNIPVAEQTDVPSLNHREANLMRAEEIEERATWFAIGLNEPQDGQPHPARAALQSGLARFVAVVLGLAVALVVTATEALDPNAAWGTSGDLLKMFGAAGTIPALLNQARKAAAPKGG